MPVTAAHLADIKTLLEAHQSAKAAYYAKLEALAPEMGEGDSFSLTGAPVPIVTKKDGKVSYYIIPAPPA